MAISFPASPTDGQVYSPASPAPSYIWSAARGVWLISNAAAGSTGVTAWNTRTGAVTLSSSDVTTALTFTPYNSTNPSGYQTAANITTTLASPPAIGASAAAGGSFTTLSAASTVSGTGFSAYLASPPAIGGTAAAAGSFTTVAASAAITPSQTSGIVGTTTNNSVNAGSVGEFVSSAVASGSALAMSNGVALNITSISLTAGDWDVEGLAAITPAATTTITNFQGGVSTTSATLGSVSSGARFSQWWSSFAPGANPVVLPTGRQRLSLSGTTTVYLVNYAAFATSTCAGYGYLAARRIR